MTGKQDHELIEQATTFEGALNSALEVVNSMVFSHKGNQLIFVMDEVKYIDIDFTKGEITRDTFQSFYKAVLLLHGNLILLSELTNKNEGFTKRARVIHLNIINEIKSLEHEVLKMGRCDLQDKDKYLDIWKKLLKNIIYLCRQYSENRNASQNNVKNESFWLKLRQFPKIPLSWLKKILSTKIDFKFQTGSVAENDNPNQPQSPPPANQSGVSLEMIHMAIIMSVVFIGLILALTVFR